jgi:hypothetical protein
MLEPIPFAGMVEIDESFDRTASHMAGEYVSNTEPVAYAMFRDGEYYDAIHPDEQAKTVGEYDIPLYTHPVKEQDTDCQYCKQGCIRCDARKQLTDEEITNLFRASSDHIEFARAILRKASEK